ncbi:MAG: hypothetical protein U9O89_02325 [Thermoproteota archaeon]|nr:hypothetical protein [Thermoproteota archaeon]
MTKRAVIVVSLVEESEEETNEELEKQILDGLSEHPPTIPWLKKVEKVTVTDR